jgi:acyl transferase domain-containing protein
VSDLTRRFAGLSAVRLAYAARQLEGQGALLRAEPVAIVGLACRFPGRADAPDSFWTLLAAGGDAIREVPADRWDIDALYDPDPSAPGKMCSRSGGFLEAVDRFDADFFGIAPREAESMDPQQRLLLEVSWEAFERASQPRERLFGSPTGVFVGISTCDYAALLARRVARQAVDAYRVSGTTLSVAAGRLSYVLGLTGPSVAVDTACSSSLVALHLACQSLRQRECALALAGGVGLLLAPEPSVAFSKAGMLAPDGRCKTFDAAADGYVRGEGCGVVVLKRLGDALADGDRIWAVIRGSAVNQDGASGGLTVPSGPSQEAVIRQALAGAGLEANQVGYVEAHGTGTALGDPIETHALAAALCRDRTPDRPLLVGSVKTNIGHLEAAAGIAGAIKTVLALQRGWIPPHLHFRTPNPRIDWTGGVIAVAAGGMAWPASPGRRIAGVSAFGFSGTNAHLLLEEGPGESREPRGLGRPVHLLTISAKSEEALAQLARRYRDLLDAWPDASLGELCQAAIRGRSLFAHRLAIVAASRAELQAGCDATLAGGGGSADVLWAGPVREGPTVRYDVQAGERDLRQELRRLARAYVEGSRIEWEAFDADPPRPDASLPTYPFRRERVWFDPVGAAETAGAPEGAEQPPAPLPGRRLALPLSREIRFEASFGRRAPALLEEHGLFGRLVVAGATWLAMVREAAWLGLGWDEVWLEELLFERALTIAGEERRAVQTLLLPEAEDGAAVHVLSRAVGDEGSAAWVGHVRGRIRRPGAGEAEASEPPPAAAWRDTAQRDWAAMEGPAFYGEIAEAGHHLGDSFRRIRRLWTQGREACGLLEVAPRPDGEPFPLHPGVLDGCFQLFCIWGRRLRDGREGGAPDPDATYIPFRLERTRFFGRPAATGRLWCHVTVRTVEADTHEMTGDILLAGEDGEPLLTIDGLTARRLERGALGTPREESATRVGRAAPPRPDATAILWRIDRAPAHLRRSLLRDYLREQVAATLRLPSPQGVRPDRGLFEMGIDSLMALELKARCEADLERALRPTLVFDHPSVEALTDALAALLQLPPEGSSTVGASGAAAEAGAVDGAIAEEIARLEALLGERHEP